MLTAALALAAPQSAEAAPRRDDRPWGRGLAVPSFGIGAGGLFSDIANVSFGLGFNYFIINGLSVGLSFSDTILIYRSTIRAQYPGIEDALPTNIFSITPNVQYVFYRSPRFSPYVGAGVGPVFFNHGGGVHGRWTAGPGVYINVVGPLFIDVGIGFSGMFPSDACNEAWTYTPSTDTGSVVLDVCSFQWGPRIGPVLAFGGGRKARQRRREREQQRSEPPPYYEPATNPMDEAVEPTPMPRTTPVDPDAPSEDAPTDVAPPPDDGSTTDVAPPDDVAPTEVAPPPSDEAPPPSDEAPADVAPPPSDGAPGGGSAPGDEAPARSSTPPVEPSSP